MSTTLDHERAAVAIEQEDTNPSVTEGALDSASPNTADHVRTRAQREPRRAPVLHTILRTLKGIVLAAEVSAAILLTLYSGLVAVLPTTPPSVRVHPTSAGADIATRPTFYCWLTPGRGVCADAGEATAARLPSITAAHGASLTLSVAPPAPTSCSAAASDPRDDAAPALPLPAEPPQRAATGNATGNAAAGVSYQVAISLPPGSYLLTLTCSWSGRPALRWLDGQGAATYALALRVTP